MLGELRLKGFVPEHRVGAIYSPAGLHLRAETPAEIAFSIIAEAQAVLCGGEGGFLRSRGAGIHEQLAKDGTP
jgi:xanthine/CO dehydrogenase XdhC/CoxF family maturation factor